MESLKTLISAVNVITDNKLKNKANKSELPKFDNSAIENSKNGITSGAVYSALQNKQDTLTIATEVAEGNNNPVTSGAVHTAIQNIPTGGTYTSGTGINIDSDNKVNIKYGNNTLTDYLPISTMTIDEMEEDEDRENVYVANTYAVTTGLINPYNTYRLKVKLSNGTEYVFDNLIMNFDKETICELNEDICSEPNPVSINCNTSTTLREFIDTNTYTVIDTSKTFSGYLIFEIDEMYEDNGMYEIYLTFYSNTSHENVTITLECKLTNAEYVPDDMIKYGHFTQSQGDFWVHDEESIYKSSSYTCEGFKVSQKNYPNTSILTDEFNIILSENKSSYEEVKRNGIKYPKSTLIVDDNFKSKITITGITTDSDNSKWRYCIVNASNNLENIVSTKSFTKIDNTKPAFLYVRFYDSDDEEDKIVLVSLDDLYTSTGDRKYYLYAYKTVPTLIPYKINKDMLDIEQVHYYDECEEYGYRLVDEHAIYRLRENIPNRTSSVSESDYSNCPHGNAVYNFVKNVCTDQYGQYSAFKDTTVTSGSSKVVTSGAVYNALQNVSITCDDTVTATSSNPVKSSGIYNAILRDTVVTSGSSNLITSGAVYTAIQNATQKDTVVTAGSSNLITSGAVYNAVKNLEEYVGDLCNAKQDKLTFDTAVTENSPNSVTSGTIFTAIKEKSLPEVTTADNYKLLMVVDGKWEAVTLENVTNALV